MLYSLVNACTACQVKAVACCREASVARTFIVPAAIIAVCMSLRQTHTAVITEKKQAFEAFDLANLHLFFRCNAIEA